MEVLLVCSVFFLAYSGLGGVFLKYMFGSKD